MSAPKLSFLLDAPTYLRIAIVVSAVRERAEAKTRVCVVCVRVCMCVCGGGAIHTSPWCLVGTVEHPLANTG